MGDLGADAAMALTSDMLWTAVLLAAPVIGISTLVGLGVSILQVVTQIQESSLSFVPKLLAAVATLLLLGGWMLTTLGRYAILFSPSGSLVGDTARTGKIILWVLDSTKDPANTKEQTLITIFARSGLIGAYPVNNDGDTLMGPPDPTTGVASPKWDSYTRDPRPAGL